VAQKQVKAEGPGAFKFVLGKSCFWLWLIYGSQPLWLGCWPLAKANAGKSPTEDTLYTQYFFSGTFNNSI
jgi:hypothetical protein